MEAAYKEDILATTVYHRYKQSADISHTDKHLADNPEMNKKLAEVSQIHNQMT